jgi:hypothetical protein
MTYIGRYEVYSKETDAAVAAPFAGRDEADEYASWRQRIGRTEFGVRRVATTTVPDGQADCRLW